MKMAHFNKSQNVNVYQGSALAGSRPGGPKDIKPPFG
jgi:hypothetical protein